MDDLERARNLWIEEKESYEKFVDYLCCELRKLISDPYVQIYGRPKDIDSLLKKLIRKPDKTYETMTDKAGIRIIAKYSDQVDIFSQIIEERFREHNKDDKRRALIQNEQIGYQGIHYDIRLSSEEAQDIGFVNMSAEIQVRTMAQHLWSDMSHELGYKSELPISDSNSRQLLRLSALIELADEEFLKLKNAIEIMPEFSSNKTLGILEKQFFKYLAVSYDRELSINAIEQLGTAYGAGGFLKAKEEFDTFCNVKSEVLSHIYDTNRNVPNRPIFLFQPECLMIFHLLDRDKFTLREKWNETYPPGELESLAILWGEPYSED